MCVSVSVSFFFLIMICFFRQYVQDVFANCLPNKRDQAELQLRNLILETHQAGTLMTTDWSEMDLPR